MNRLLPWWPLAVIVIAGVFGWGWMRSHDGRVRAEALAEQQQARADSLMSVVAEQEEHVSQVDAQAVELRAALEIARADEARLRTVANRAESRAVGAVTAASATLDATLEQMGAVADSVRSQLATERAAHADVATALRAQVTSLDMQLVLADSATAVIASQVRARDALVQSLEQALAAQTRLAEDYRQAAYPGLLARIWRQAPLVLGSVAVGAVGGVLVWSMVSQP